MATTKSNTRFDLRTEATKPLFAGVGVTDLAVEKVRGLVSTATNPKALRAAIEARVAELQAEAKAYPSRVSAMVDDNVNSATDVFGDLVERGESLVGRIRRQQATQRTVKSARTTVSKAKTTNTQAKHTSDAATKTARTAAKKATATVKKTNTKPATKKAAVTKSSAKATVTAATKTADNAAQAVSDAAKKVGN